MGNQMEEDQKKEKEEEEYKKRITEMIESVEKDRTKDTPELYQELLEMLKEIKKEAKKKRNRKYRNEKCLIGFVFAIREYYRLRIDPNYPHKNKLFKKEIHSLFNLVYEELTKPHYYTLKFNKEPNNPQDVADRERIIRNMIITLGQENMNADFFKKYKLRTLGIYTSFWNVIKIDVIKLIFGVIFGILAIIFIINVYSNLGFLHNLFFGK
jgi:hypothetical protein